MNEPSGGSPHDSLFDGLRLADEAAVQAIYDQFRRPFVMTMVEKGVTPAEAQTLFQAAVVTLAGDASSEPPSMYAALTQLAKAHLDHPRVEDEEAESEIPDADGDPLADTLSNMQRWAADPSLEDEYGVDYRVWRKLSTLAAAGPATGETQQKSAEPAANKFWRLAMAALLLLTGGYAVYQWASRPADLFKDNFAPPESLMADHRLRYEAATDSSGQTPYEACDQLLQEADRLYQAGSFEAAQDPLLLLVLDSAAVTCQSDAWYYLALLRLKMDDPATSIECLSKIEDLEHFGEDIQWNMALSMLLLSEQEPSLKEKTIRAVEKVANSTRQEDRKQKAEKLLKKLKNS